jgi:Flp pilus assembly pilin Flp
MSNFLKYLRNDKGGAVEYVLMIAGIGGVVLAAFQVTAVRTGFSGMFTEVFKDATTAVNVK